MHQLEIEHKPVATVTFEEIYQEYGEKILNLAYRMTGVQEVARDLTQDVFIKVHQNMDSFRGDAQLYTWIYRIATNHILNYLAKEKRRKWMSFMDRPLGEVLKESEIEPDFWGKSGTMAPDKKLEKKQREKIIWKSIQSLPVKYRVPFVLNRYEGMNYQEAADTLGLSLSALEARLHRAKKMLINKLEKYALDL